MKPIQTVMIVGLGALGTVYAEKFSHCPDTAVYILVDEARKARYARDGVSYNGRRFDFTYVLPEETGIKADLILLTTKSSGMGCAIEMMQNFVGENTLILSLMNGVSSEDRLMERFGANKVLYAMYFGHVSTNVNGKIAHDGVNRIFFGEADNTTLSTRVERCRDFFDKAGVDYTIPEDMLHELWRKFMVIVGLNQSTVVLGANYGIFQNHPSALAFARALMEEGTSIAKALGVRDTEKMLQTALQAALDLPAETTPSILQDYTMHRQMEVDIFSGEICRLGRKMGIPTPYNDAVRDILTILNEKNAEIICG